MREKYIILLAVIVIICVCYSGFIFLPDGPEPAGAMMRKALKEAWKVNPKDLVVPPPRRYEDEIGHDKPDGVSKGNKIMAHEEDDAEMDPHKIEDKRRLWEKINQDQIPKPVQEEDQRKLIPSSSDVGGSSGKVGHVPSAGINDEETEKRRETVKNVSEFWEIDFLWVFGSTLESVGWFGSFLNSDSDLGFSQLSLRFIEIFSGLLR